MASNSNQKKQPNGKKPTGTASSSPRFSYLFLARLLVLLSILLGLAFYAWRSSSYRSAIKSAELLISNERNREASKAVNAIKDAYGENAQLRLLLAKTYRQAGKQDQFMRELELAEPLGLELATVQGEKLLFDAQSGTLPNVRADVGQWLESHPQEFEDAGRSIAFGLLRKEDFDGVNNFLSTWQQQSPGSPRIAWFRSMIHLARREWKKALSELEPALKEHPDFLPFYLNAGTAYSGDQQFEKAEAAFEKYLAKEPEEWDAWLKYSEVLRKLGKANDALKKLQPIAQNPGLPPSLRLQLGKLYLEAGDHQKTIDTVLGQIGRAHV
mgnify:CR=1 FL=1